jgi:CheY-like chemotaxis protein
VSGAERKLKILVVEDEALVAMLMEDLLSDFGHEVVAIAGRLEQGLELARTGEFDCAVLDLNLNGERTYPIAEALAARGVPFLFVTGYGAAGVEQDWINRPILQKPFEPHRLADALAQAIAR